MEHRLRALELAGAAALFGLFVRFALVGATGVAVNMAALYLLYGVAGLPLVIASAAATEIAVLHNFVWNHRWTFRRRTLEWRPFLRFNLVSLGGMAITTALLWFLVTLNGLHYLAANAVAVAAATFWNFIVNLHWTWGRAG